ncbi:MAG: M16 family metallopeptidase, partial [Caulobacteraceae bacterium]
ADGVVFDAAALDKERGVVLAEKEASNSRATVAANAVTRFQAPKARSTLRDPIGDEAVLRAATPRTLSAFYARWYRPDNAVVTMVGALPLEVLGAKVKAAFGSWRRYGPPPVRAPRIPPDPGRGLDAFSVDQPAMVDAMGACRLVPPDPRSPDDLARVRRMALGEIWRAILNQRLAPLRLDAANRLIGASVEAEDNGGDLRSVCLNVIPASGGWRPPLRAAQRELQRFRDSGPTEREVDAAMDSVRSHLRGAISEAPNRTAAELADALAEAQLRGGVVAEPRQALRAYDLAVENLTVADVRAAFARDWRGAGPLISIVSSAPPPSEALRAAWTAVDGASALSAYADRRDVAWGYDFGKPGTVASRKIVPDGQFVRIQFRNGVRLNFKQTAFARDSVELIVRFGAGRKEIENDGYLPATFGATLFALGGVGKHSFEDMQRMLQNDALKFSLTIGDTAFLIAKDVARPNLADQLNVLTAYLSDPGFRPSIDPILRTVIDAAYRLVESSPQLSGVNALAGAIAPNGPQTLPPRSALDGLGAAAVAGLLKPLIARDRIDVTLVGDIDEKTAIGLVASTFGALPARAAPVPVRGDTAFLRFPATAAPTLRVSHHGPDDKASVEAVWPLYVATPARRREEYAIKLLAAIFNDDLRRRVRVELGKSYAPAVNSQMPDDADQGELTALVESYPADIEAMSGEIRAIARRLREGEITAAQLEAARAPLLAEDRQRMVDNRRWAFGLSGSADNDQPLRDLLTHADILASIRLDEIKKAAADWLAREPWTVVSVPAGLQAPATP